MEAFRYKEHKWSALKDPCLVGAVTHRTPALTSVYSLSEVNWRVGQHFVRMCTWVYGIIHMGCLLFLIWWTISSDKGIHMSHCQGWKFTRSMETWKHLPWLCCLFFPIWSTAGQHKTLEYLVKQLYTSQSLSCKRNLDHSEIAKPFVTIKVIINKGEPGEKVTTLSFWKADI